MVESEALLQLGHLTGEGRRVCSAAREDLDCHGTAVAGAEQPIDDLPFAAFAVTAVTELGERTATAFQVARRHVVEHQCAAAEMSFGEGRLDRRLAYRQPVECPIELVLIDQPETELLAKAGSRGVRRQRPGGGKLGPGIEDAADHQGQDEVAAAVAVRAEQPIEADLARCAEGRVDMTMRQRADDGNGLLVPGNNGAAFEQCLEAGDPLVRPVGEVQERALLDLASRGSSRATGWPGASRDWGRLRYTWEHHSNCPAFKQSKSTRLHGYVSVPVQQIKLRYQYLDGTERGKLRLNQPRGGRSVSIFT